MKPLTLVGAVVVDVVDVVPPPPPPTVVEVEAFVLAVDVVRSGRVVTALQADTEPPYVWE